MLFTINAVLTIALQKSAKSTTFINSTIILKKNYWNSKKTKKLVN